MAEAPAGTKQVRASRSARLPQVPIERSIPIARALQELAAPSTPHRIAQRLGVSPSAGPFRTVLGAAGYYGLIRQDGERRVLTSLGERVVAGGDGGVAARQEAVAQTGFRNILSTFRGREVNEAVIAARLQDDFGLTTGAAGLIAKALVEACEQSSLIVNRRFDAAAIETALAAAPSNGSAGQDGQSRRAARTSAGPQPARPVSPSLATPVDRSPSPPESEGRPLAPGLHIDIQLHIPATATPEQIDQIFASMAKHLYGRG